MDKNRKPLGIYIHIPFCVRKCRYCDFLSMPADEKTHERYVRTLIREIKNCRVKFDCSDTEYDVRTVYIGGGTPSVIKAVYIEEILMCLRDVFGMSDFDGAETTIEINPGAVSDDKIALYRRAGINRVSIGLQSAEEDELKELGRIHCYDDFERTYRCVREAGIRNVNVDIMTAIPKQTKESLERTIGKVTGLKDPPEHISAYSLILEEGTEFYDRYGGKQGKFLFDEDEERELYYLTVKRLAETGYRRYEISNFARPSFESRHNSAYWRRVDYMGLGLGASSLIDNIRYRNTTDPDTYLLSSACADSFLEKNRLSIEECMEEFMFLGLRMSDGVSFSGFEDTFGKKVMDVYGDRVDALVRDGLLGIDGDLVSLTDKGIDYGNYVFSRFLI